MNTDKSQAEQFIASIKRGIVYTFGQVFDGCEITRTARNEIAWYVTGVTCAMVLLEYKTGEEFEAMDIDFLMSELQKLDDAVWKLTIIED